MTYELCEHPRSQWEIATWRSLLQVYSTEDDFKLVLRFNFARQ